MKPKVTPDADVIVPDAKYGGRFVALRSFVDNTVMASGRDPGRVIRAAKRKGAESPVIVFVPAPAVTCLF